MDNIILRGAENMAQAFKAASADMKVYSKNMRRVFQLNKKG